MVDGLQYRRICLPAMVAVMSAIHHTAKEEKSYRLTPFGFLGPAVTDAIVRKLKQNGSNAIVLNERGELEWAEVAKEPA